jgi:hypothetical protein
MRKTMNYTKPEVAVLGEAVRVIDQNHLIKGAFVVTEGARAPRANPAYDLDE